MDPSKYGFGWSKSVKYLFNQSKKYFLNVERNLQEISQKWEKSIQKWIHVQNQSKIRNMIEWWALKAFDRSIYGFGLNFNQFYSINSWISQLMDVDNDQNLYLSQLNSDLINPTKFFFGFWLIQWYTGFPYSTYSTALTRLILGGFVSDQDTHV